MTIVILDRDGEAPYADWLGVDDLVVLPSGPAVELAVLELARTTTISALVATATPDLVLAGALRDHLGIPGQGRAAATVFADPVATRACLADAGVPVIPAGAVLRASDLYWYRHRWGPLRVRNRKETGWPTAAVLRDDADLKAFTANGLAPTLVSVPSLFAEPLIEGDRRVDTDGPALAALPTTPGAPYRVIVAGELVDTVDSPAGRGAVRAQAGLAPIALEATRWAS
jgi:hypothetical protein